jgi:hypothetical protein
MFFLFLIFLILSLAILSPFSVASRFIFFFSISIAATHSFVVEVKEKKIHKKVEKHFFYEKREKISTTNFRSMFVSILCLILYQICKISTVYIITSEHGIQ